MTEPLSLSDGLIAGFAKMRGMTFALVGVTFRYAVLVLPPLIIDLETYNSLSGDMIENNLPEINFFIAHSWNFIDFPGYSASLPGHYMLLAWASRVLGYDTINSGTLPIRLLHGIFGCVYSLVIFVFLTRMQRTSRLQARFWVAAALWSSAAPSYHFVLSDIYISTDVPALTIYACYLHLVTFFPSATAAITISATALVYWRQSYAPVLAAPFLAASHRLRFMLLSPMLLSLVVPGSVLLFYVIQF